MDRAGKAYWDDVWQARTPPAAAVDPASRRLGNRFNQRLHAFFQHTFRTVPTQGRALLEIGCAQSAWLPYFARAFGFVVSGLDYSEIGCALERDVLRAAGVSGDIVCADFFEPPPALRSQFDVVCSFGVAEHFEDTAAALRAFAAYLRPGGLMITLIPNLTGLVGRLTKLFNRPVYDRHVPLTAADLGNAHVAANLSVLRCEYFLSVGFGVANLNGLDPYSVSTRTKRLALRTLERMSVLVWVAEDRLVRLPSTRAWSPFAVCVARTAE
jgi:SAM-dependent methyltransferase